MKKSISIIVISILVLSSLTASFAEAGITESIEFSGETQELSLDVAVNQMFENNASIKQLALAVEANEEAYKEFMSPIYDARRYVSNEKKEGTANYYKLTILPELTEDDMVFRAKRTLASTTEALKAGVEEAFFKTIQAKENVDIQKESLDTNNELLKQVNLKFELGLVAKKDILAAQSDCLTAQDAYNSALDGYKTAKMSLNILLDNDVLNNIELSNDLTIIPFEKINIDEAINQALELRNDLKNAKVDYELAEVNFNILSGQYPDNTFKYKQAQAGVEIEKQQYETTKKDIEKDVLTKYMDVLTNKEKIDLSEKQVQLAEESLRIVKLSYELGQVVLIDVQNVENAYKGAKLGLSSAKLDYNLAVLAFEDAITIGR